LTPIVWRQSFIESIRVVEDRASNCGLGRAGQLKPVVSAFLRFGANWVESSILKLIRTHITGRNCPIWLLGAIRAIRGGHFIRNLPDNLVLECLFSP